MRFDADYRYCEYCGHTPLQHYSLFNRDIVNPIRKFGFVGAGKTGFIALKRGVLDRILLRRTKAGRSDEMVLPPKVVTIEANFLDAKENDFYQAIYTQSQAQFGSYVTAGTLLNNYAHVLDLLTRLRQAINHPYLVIHSKRGQEQNEAAAASGGASGPSAPPGLEGGGVCGLCFEDAEDAVVTGCGHAFCRACMRDFIEALDPAAASQCPSCHQPLSVDLSSNSPSAAVAYHSHQEAAVEDEDGNHEVSIFGGAGSGSTSAAAAMLGGVAALGRAKRGILSRIDLKHFQSSTKMEALLEELHLMRENDASAKAIVFSQYVSFLGICAPGSSNPGRATRSSPRARSHALVATRSSPRARRHALFALPHPAAPCRRCSDESAVRPPPVWKDLLEHRLMVCGIRVVKLNGGMAASAREAALKIYREDPGEPCRGLEAPRRAAPARESHSSASCSLRCRRFLRPPLLLPAYSLRPLL